MKNCSLFLLVLLSLSSVAQANNNNYGFYAENRLSPVFIEKCKLWRQALKGENIELALSFLDPAKVIMRPKYAEKHIRSKIKVLKTTLSYKGYKELPMKINTKTEPKYSNVIIDWKADNGIGGSSCTFKEISPRHWRLN